MTNPHKTAEMAAIEYKNKYADDVQLWEHADLAEAAFLAGFAEGHKAGMLRASEIAEQEHLEYEKSAKKMDLRGDFHLGDNEINCAVTAQYLAEALSETKTAEGDKG